MVGTPTTLLNTDRHIFVTSACFDFFFFFFFRARQLMPRMHLSLRLIVQP
jgi:hypothetical protein